MKWAITKAEMRHDIFSEWIQVRYVASGGWYNVSFFWPLLDECRWCYRLYFTWIESVAYVIHRFNFNKTLNWWWTFAFTWCTIFLWKKWNTEINHSDNQYCHQSNTSANPWITNYHLQFWFNKILSIEWLHTTSSIL